MGTFVMCRGWLLLAASGRSCVYMMLYTAASANCTVVHGCFAAHRCMHEHACCDSGRAGAGCAAMNTAVKALRGCLFEATPPDVCFLGRHTRHISLTHTVEKHSSQPHILVLSYAVCFPTHTCHSTTSPTRCMCPRLFCGIGGGSPD